MKNPELTVQPEELYNQELRASELKIYGHKLGDPVSSIDMKNIDTITLEKPPENARELFGDYGKDLLYTVNGETHVFSFKKRIESVIRNGGCFHMKQPVTYIIDHQILIGIILYCEKVGLYQDIKTQDIEKRFGRASSITKKYFEEDDSLASTLFSYDNRQFYINVSGSSWGDNITHIHFGIFPFMLSWRRDIL